MTGSTTRFSNDVGGREHPGLDRRDLEVLEDRVYLRLDEGYREVIGRGDGPGILGGDGGDHRHSEDPVRRHRLEIGLDPGAPAGVRAGDGQDLF
jgi:hypothetical protein